MADWARDAVFYHIFPLGLCGAPERNDFSSAPVDRLDALLPWLDHVKGLGADAVYLGPVFESSTHGYDTADYFNVDRRLGTNATLARFSRAVHEKGLRLVFDGVFNHVGRDFWAFRDLKEKLGRSQFASWFHALDFNGRSPCGDPFRYEGWSGHYSLVKLETGNRDVRNHLFAAVDRWVEEFGIDGLRLDAADCLDLDFLRALSSHCRALSPDFWLMGEIVHGDYRKWINKEILDSVTNYECYKGLYSSHVDANYFEIAYSLNRLFGPQGIYRDLTLYNFADNHDVNRVASTLKDIGDLEPLYCLLFTMPGAPSVYYGSEWGIQGRKNGTDWPLRPRLDLATAGNAGAMPALAGTIARLAAIRRSAPALRHGSYEQLHVASRQFAFLRRLPEGGALVAVNSAGRPAALDVGLPGFPDGAWTDLLHPGEAFPARQGRIRIADVPAHGARVLAPRG